MLGFFSSSPNWFGHPPPLHPQASVPPPFFGYGGGTHSLAERGWGGPNSDDGTDSVVLKVYTAHILGGMD